MEHLIRLPKAKRWAPNIYKIGLTGGIGNGKSSGLNVIGKHHVTLDCDKLAHNLYLKGNPLLEPLVREFGSDILLADGNVNRPFLARKVSSCSFFGTT